MNIIIEKCIFFSVKHNCLHLFYILDSLESLDNFLSALFAQFLFTKGNLT